MKIAGIDIQGKSSVIVVLDKNPEGFKIVKAITKIGVANTSDQDELRTFYRTFTAFIQDDHIEKIFIKQRNKKGTFAGGAEGFKLEAIIQLVTIPVVFISPVSISNKTKKLDLKDMFNEVFIYQKDALKTAITGAISKC